jgi:glycosyltransferase involved in cell wall biosynthesis
VNEKLYVIIPRLENTGAMKGAVAICNSLLPSFSITLFCLKGVGVDPGLSSGVTLVSLADVNSWYDKYYKIKKIMGNGSYNQVVLSFCFSADMMNYLFRSRAKIITSMRGDLKTAYRKNYGLLGVIAAFFHHFILCQFNHVVVISESMKRQVEHINFKRLSVVNNYIDEPLLEKFRLEKGSLVMSDPEKTVLYIGSFTKGKRVDVLINSAITLYNRGLDFKVIMLGKGPLFEELTDMVQEANLEKFIIFKGHVETPYSEIERADVVVLPSEAEGVPRSILESLYFGIPCIVRDVSANSELIQEGVNGYIFTEDDELESVLEKALSTNRLKSNRSIMPSKFSYQENSKKMLKIIREEMELLL